MAAGPITRGSYPKALAPGLKVTFGAVYDGFVKERDRLFDNDKSSRAYEEEMAHVNMEPAPVKDEGAAIKYDSMQQLWVKRYTHLTYALGYMITQEEFEDNLYPKIGKDRTMALAWSLDQALELAGADVYNFAFTGGSYAGGDGVSLCNTAHPTLGGTYSNKPTNDVDISELALENANIQIDSLVDNRNNPIKIIAQQLCIPKELRYKAIRIVKNPDRPATADRDINAMYVDGTFTKPMMVSHYFSSADAYFIRTNAFNGMKHYVRINREFDHDNEFETYNGKYKARCRDSFGNSEPRALWGTQGSGA